MSGLDRALRKVAKKLTTKFGQRVILVTSNATGTPSTGAVSTSETQERVVRGALSEKRLRNTDGALVRVTELTVAAEGLYVEAQFRLPTVGDTVIVGPDEIFGTDTNPGWTGGVAHRVTDVQEQWGPEEVVAYVLTLER